MSEPVRLRFLLNTESVDCTAPPGLPLLDWLQRRGLRGTRDGCREGECGACMVLVGTLDGKHLSYEACTSCLVPLVELEGRHVVTIEGLSADSALSPVQEAILAEDATQCGFCTPGIVVSLTAGLLDGPDALQAPRVRALLGGHLCRCTGYASLLRAGGRLASIHCGPALVEQGEARRTRLDRWVRDGILPAGFQTIPSRLAALTGARRDLPPPGTGGDRPIRVAGGTDLYVERGEEIAEGRVESLSVGGPRSDVRREGDRLEIGGLVTFSGFGAEPEVRRLLPDIDRILSLLASPQIRARATVAGNVVNASPIGDLAILLLALRAQVQVRGPRGTRTVALRDFYLDYHRIDLSPDEIVTQFSVFLSSDETRVGFEKVSKRTHLDIASVNSALHLTLRGEEIASACLAMGGVAPVPMVLDGAGARLVGRPVGEECVRDCLDAIQDEISPVSDVRGHALYKRLLARHLVIAQFARLFPATIRPEAFL